jgi:hypothetical protein
MFNSAQDKKLKNKSFMLKSYGRTDYKVAPSIALDLLAALASVLFAVAMWVLN